MEAALINVSAPKADKGKTVADGAASSWATTNFKPLRHGPLDVQYSSLEAYVCPVCNRRGCHLAACLVFVWMVSREAQLRQIQANVPKWP